MESIRITEKAISTHVNKHAQYILVARSLGSKKSNELRMHIHQEMVEANDTLNKIVGIGDQMIDNWVNGNTDAPQMPVTERLFIEALKEQGRRGTKTTVDIEMENMDREMIEGKSKEEPKKVKAEEAVVVEGEPYANPTP